MISHIYTSYNENIYLLFNYFYLLKPYTHSLGAR